MNKLERHAEYIVNDLNCNINVKYDLKLQFIDHLNLLKEDYMKQGIDEDEAIKLAVGDFGDGSTIIPELYDLDKTKFNIFKALKITLLTVYCVFLALVLLNPMSTTAQWVATTRNAKCYWEFTINIIPFKTIINYILNLNNNNFYIFLFNIFGKMLLFIPVGLLMPLVFNYVKRLKNFIKVILIVTTTLEVLRAIFPLGVSNIDNVILHSIGALIGFCFYLLYNRIRYIPLTNMLYKNNGGSRY